MKNDVTKLSGRAFIIVTDDGIEHIRQSQPCYGELRKYESTHKGDCTQPGNYKPGDLYYPFPNGTPVRLLIKNLYPSLERNLVCEIFFSEESPWIRGFNSVEFIKDDKGVIKGFDLKDTKIDTTVLVNLLKHLDSCKAPSLEKYLKSGLTPKESMAIIAMNGGFDIEQSINPPYYYISPKVFSAKRFFSQNPVDLTGGTLFDRVDYNRTSMQDVFLGNTSDGATDWVNFLRNKFPAGRVVLKDDLQKLKDAFSEMIEKEKDPVNKPYIWKKTDGRTNAM